MRDHSNKASEAAHPDPAAPDAPGNAALLQSSATRLAAATGALLTVEDIAGRLQIGTSTAWRLVAERKIPAPDFRIGKRICRWRPATIEKFILKGGAK